MTEKSGTDQLPSNETTANNRVFWVGVLLGGAVMTFGIRGLIQERAAANTFAVARLVVGAAIFHDALLAPLVFGVGLLLRRFAPPWTSGPLQVGLFVSAVVSLFSWPFVRGYGRAATNPTALPANYGRGLALILALVWLSVAAVLALKARKFHR